MEADAAAPGNSEEAEAFATAKGLTYFEASAKDHESVDVVLRHTLHLGLSCCGLHVDVKPKSDLSAPEVGQNIGIVVSVFVVVLLDGAVIEVASVDTQS